MYETRYVSIALLDTIGRVLLTSEQFNTTVGPKFALSLESHVLKGSMLMDEYDENLKQKLGVSRNDFNMVDNTIITKNMHGAVKKEMYIFALKPKKNLTLRFKKFNSNPSIFLPLEDVRKFSDNGKIELSSCAKHTLNFIEKISSKEICKFEEY